MARKAGEAFADNAASTRARGVAGIPGLMCLAWLPYRIWQEAFGAAQPIAGTVFTLAPLIRGQVVGFEGPAGG